MYTSINKSILTTSLVLFIAALISPAIGQNLSPNENILTIIKSTGSVLIFTSKKKTWQDLTVPYRLRIDDKVRTLSGSSCEIRFNTSNIKIKENSEVTVKNIIEQVNLRMSYGEILMKLKKLPPGSSFKVETPQAIAGARGTKYKVRVIEKESLTTVSSLQDPVLVQSIAEPNKSVVINDFEERQICPWDKTIITAKGTGILSKYILGQSVSQKDNKEIQEIPLGEYGNVFGALARVTTKRAAVTDAHRKLAEKIYGVVIDSETSLEDYAVKNDTIRTHVKGVVRGAKEVNVKYYSDGSISVRMETEGTRVKARLIPLTGDIYGIDCISGPEILSTEDFEEFLR